MFEKAVQNLLKTYLRDYLCVDEVSLNEIVVSLWSGKLEISDLELQDVALEQLLGLDVTTTKSKVEKLYVTVPWSHLQSQPVVIKLKGIHIVAQPKRGRSASVSSLEPRDDKMDRLRRLEFLEEEQKEEMTGEDSSSSSSFWEKLGTKILDNLQLVLEDIHIRFEQSERTAGLRLDRVSLLSTNERWEEAFVVDSKILRKVARISDLRVYVGNPRSKAHAGEELDMFAQGHVEMKLTMHKGENKLVQVEVDFGSTRCSVHKHQILALLADEDDFKKKRFHDLTPKQKWYHAITMVIQKNIRHRREMFRKAWVYARRGLYISLFKRRLEATKSWLKEDLSESEFDQLEALERDERMHFADIVQLRKVAYEEVRLHLGDPTLNVRSKRRRSRKRAEEQEEKNAKQQGGWFSSWWYGDNSQPAPTEQKEESIAKIAQISEDDREKLFQTIGYDPEKDGVKLAGKDSVPIQFVVDAKISNGFLDIYAGHQQETPIASLRLGKIQLSMEFQKQIRSLHLVADSLMVHDLNDSTAFKDIVAPKDAQTQKKLLVVNIYRKIDDSGKLIVDLRLEQALQVVYNHAFVEAITDTFSPPPKYETSAKSIGNNGLIPDDLAAGGQDNSGGSTWETYQAAYSQSSIEELYDADYIPDVTFHFEAPTVLIPQHVTAGNQNDNKILYIQLGRFTIGQKSQDDWFLDTEQFSAKLKLGSTYEQSIVDNINFKAGLTICNDRQELTKPRMLLRMNLPVLSVKIPTSDVHHIQSIFAHQFGNRPAYEDGLTTIVEEETTTLVPERKSSDTKKQLDVLATRVSFAMQAEIGEIELGLESDTFGTVLSLQQLQLQYQARTFDSELRFTTTSVTMVDTKESGQTILHRSGEAPVASLAVRTTDALSPLFESYDTSIDIKFGTIEVNIHETFVQGLYKMVQSDEVFQNNSVVVRQPGKAKPTKTTTTTRYQVFSESLSLALLNERLDPICKVGLAKVDLVHDTETMRFAVAKCSMKRQRPLLTFSKSKQQQNTDDIFVMTYTKETGYVVETNPFHLILDENVYAALKRFLPPPLPPPPTTTTTSTTTTEQTTSIEEDKTSPSPSSSSSTTNTIDLQLRNTDEPFVIEFIATDNVTCAAKIYGLSMNENSGLRIHGVDFVLNRNEDVVKISNLSYCGNLLRVDRIQVVINPITRRLTGAIIDPAKTLLRRLLRMDQQGDVSNGSGPGFRLEIDSCVVGMKDINNENNVVLGLDEIRFGESKLKIEKCRLVHEEPEKLFLWCDQDSVELVLDTPITTVNIGQELGAFLNPVSRVALTSYLNTITNFSSFLTFILAANTDEANDDEEETKLMLQVNIPTLNLEADSCRPKLPNALFHGQGIVIGVETNNCVNVAFGNLSCEETNNGKPLLVNEKLDIKISPAAQVLRIDCGVGKNGDTCNLDLTPRQLYVLNSILKDNLLAPDERRPVYEPPPLDGDKKSSIYFELVVPELQGNLILDFDEEVALKNLVKSESLTEIVLDDLRFLYDGELAKLLVTTSKLSGYGGEDRMWFTDFEDLKFSIEHATVELEEPKDESKYELAVASASIHYRADLLQALFDYIAVLESLRLKNLYARELEDELNGVATAYEELLHTSKLFSWNVASISLVVPNETLEGGLLAKSVATGIVNTTYYPKEYNMVVQTNFEKTTLDVISMSEDKITGNFQILEEMSIIMRRDATLTREGATLTNKFDLMASKIQLNVLVPIVPGIGHLVRHVLATRPSQRVIRQAILEAMHEKGKISDDAIIAETDTMGTSDVTEYQVQVTVHGLQVTIQGKSYPIARLNGLDVCNVVGSSKAETGFASTINETSFKGRIGLRKIELLCFNPNNLSWEPVLETCDLICGLETIINKSNQGVRLSFESDSSVRINLHPAHVRAISLAAIQGKQMLDELMEEGEGDSSSSSSSSLKRLGIFSGFCVVVNKATIPLVVQDRTVPPGESVKVTHANMRILVQYLEFSREILLIENDAKIVTAPFLAAHVDRDSDSEMFTITFAALISFENNCDMDVQVFATTQSSSSEEDDSKVSFLLPGQRFYCPSGIANDCLIKFRLTDADSWQQVLLTNKIKDLHQISEMMGAGKSVMLNVNKVSCNPLTKISIAPIKVIESNLPCAIIVMIERQVDGETLIVEEKTVLQPSQKFSVYCNDPGKVFMRFALITREDLPGKYVPLFQHQGSYKYEFMDRGGSGRKQEVRFAQTSDTCVLYSPFWIVNASSIASIRYFMPDGRLPLDDPARADRNTTVGRPPAPPPRQDRVVEETWENQRKYPIKGWVGEMLPGNRPNWSDREGTCTVPKTKESIRLPSGWEWEGDWKVDTTVQNTDEGGWQYCTSFVTAVWSPKEGWSDIVRRRRWYRYRVKKKDVPSPPSTVKPKPEESELLPAVCLYGYETVRVGFNAQQPSSPDLCLDLTANTSNVFAAKTNDGEQFFELVLSVTRHPTYPFTKICTVSPRYIIMNEFDESVEVRCVQANTSQDPINITSATPFRWFQPAEEAKIQVQVDDTEWTPPLTVSALGECCLVLSDGRRMCCEIKRSELQGTVLVVLRQDSNDAPMYQLENLSMERFAYFQKDTTANFMLSEPFTTGPFGLTEPSKAHIIQLQFAHQETVDVNLGSVGIEQKIRLQPRRSGSMDTKTTAGLCFDSPIFLFAENEEVKWLARPPPRQAESLLNSATTTLQHKGWIPKVSKVQGTPIVLTCSNTDGHENNTKVKYGDECLVTCKTGDGRLRILSKVKQGATMELVWREKNSNEELYGNESVAYRITGGVVGDIVGQRSFELELVDEDYLVGFADNKTIGLFMERSNCTSHFVAVSLDNLHDLPERDVFVNVDIQGRSTVVRVSETSLSSVMIVHEDEDGEEQPEEIRFDISFELSDFGLSIISEYRNGLQAPPNPFEVLYISSNFHLKVIDTNYNRSYELFVHSVRIDNDIPDCIFPNLLKRSIGDGADQSSSKPVIRFKLFEKHTQLNVMYAQVFDVEWERLDIQVDEDLITMLGQLQREFVSAARAASRDKVLPYTDFKALTTGLTATQHRSKDAATFYFRDLQLSPISMRFSYYRNQFTDIEHAPIAFDSLKMHHVTVSMDQLFSELKVFYTQQIQRHIFTIIGYLLPGNPGELFSSFGGSNSVVEDLFKGAVRGVARIGTLGNTLAKVDIDYKRSRSAKPQTFGEGLARGGDHIGKGFMDGVEGLLRKPKEGADKDGIAGAFAGLGSGVMGLFTKPVAGVASAIGSTAQGMLAETESAEKLASDRQSVLRARPPRLFQGFDRCIVLIPYNHKEVCVVGKIINFLKSRSGNNDGAEEQGDFQFLASFHFTPLPFFVVHTRSFVVFGTLQEDKTLQQRNSSGGKNESVKWIQPKEQRLLETLEKSIRVTILWLENRSVDTTQGIQQAVAFWTKKFGRDTLNQCETVVRQAAKAKSQVLDTNSRLGNISNQLKSTLDIGKSPRINMQALLNVYEAVQRYCLEENNTLTEDQVLERVILESKVCESQFPLLILSVTKAYYFVLVNHGTFRIDTKRFMVALQAFEDSLLSIGNVGGGNFK